MSIGYQMKKIDFSVISKRVNKAVKDYWDTKENRVELVQIYADFDLRMPDTKLEEMCEALTPISGIRGIVTVIQPEVFDLPVEEQLIMIRGFADAREQSKIGEHNDKKRK